MSQDGGVTTHFISVILRIKVGIEDSELLMFLMKQRQGARVRSKAALAWEPDCRFTHETFSKRLSLASTLRTGFQKSAC
jgi:hypothetical protein